MVKGNQKELKEQVEKIFSISDIKEENKTTDIGHGRIECRKCQVIDQLDFLDDKENWPGLKSIVKITSKRVDKQSGEESSQTRHYITSMSANAAKINKAIRSHWAVENNLHWNLDVVFKEDDSLKKKGNSALNYNIIAKIALSLIDKERSTKKSKPSKRLLAALDDNYRANLLKV